MSGGSESVVSELCRCYACYHITRLRLQYAHVLATYRYIIKGFRMKQSSLLTDGCLFIHIIQRACICRPRYVVAQPRPLHLSLSITLCTYAQQLGLSVWFRPYVMICDQKLAVLYLAGHKPSQKPLACIYCLLLNFMLPKMLSIYS